MNDFYSPMDETPMHIPHTGDPALDGLLHEVQIAVQDVRDFTLPDDMLISAVNAASDFWGIPHPVVNVHSDTTCEIPNDPRTYTDDIIGICRQQMMEMGVYGEDAIGLVTTHETFHRVLQTYNHLGLLDPWEHELACDFAAGIRAGYQDMDTTHFENSLINTLGSETHPVGTLRVDFIEYAKHIGEQMRENNVQPTFENCIEAFNRHLIEEDSLIAQQRETATHNGFVTEQTNDGQVSFTGKKEDLQEKLSRLKSEKAYEAKEAERLGNSNNVSDQGNAIKHLRRVKSLESEINSVEGELFRLPKT